MSTDPLTVTFEVDTTSLTVGLKRAAAAAALFDIRLLCKGCPVCAHYLARRGRVLLLAVCVEAERRPNVWPMPLLARYLHSVHDRHLAGGSLSTRPVTPDRPNADGGKTLHVKRSCNGCQKSLGDVREAELTAAEFGRRLPDVRLECGCWNEVAA